TIPFDDVYGADDQPTDNRNPADHAASNRSCAELALGAGDDMSHPVTCQRHSNAPTNARVNPGFIRAMMTSAPTPLRATRNAPLPPSTMARTARLPSAERTAAMASAKAGGPSVPVTRKSISPPVWLNRAWA